MKETRRYIGHLGRVLGRRKNLSPRFVRHPGLPACVRGIYMGREGRGPIGAKSPTPSRATATPSNMVFFNRPLEISPQGVLAAMAATLEGEIVALRLTMHRAKELYTLRESKGFTLSAPPCACGERRCAGLGRVANGP